MSGISGAARSLPAGVRLAQSSDAAVVKGVGIHRIVNVKGPLGVGHLGATFVAEKKGTATLTFDISHGKDDIKLTCEVEVK